MCAKMLWLGPLSTGFPNLRARFVPSQTALSAAKTTCENARAEAHNIQAVAMASPQGGVFRIFPLLAVQPLSSCTPGPFGVPGTAPGPMFEV